MYDEVYLQGIEKGRTSFLVASGKELFIFRKSVIQVIQRGN